MIGFGAQPDGVICSRAGCGAAASWRIDWRNPKIHAADRVKTWTACDDHVEYLEAFLEARSFPMTKLPLESEVRS